MRFDPLSMRADFEKQRRAVGAYSEAYDKFAHSIAGISDISFISDALHSNSRSMEVLLVHLFGLSGVECIRSTIRLVPKEVPHCERFRYIKNIITSALPDNNVITDNSISILIKIFDDSLEPYKCTTSLRSLSESSGIAYTNFLAPPTSACLVECCQKFGIPDSLYQHHPPTTVSVFTLEGPQPATKICLKCRECGTIYNYNSFGKKKSEGERFYDAVRDFVEVSDMTYCDRRLLLMYSLLRLVKYVHYG